MGVLSFCLPGSNFEIFLHCGGDKCIFIIVANPITGLEPDLIYLGGRAISRGVLGPRAWVEVVNHLRSEQVGRVVCFNV